MMSRCRRLDRGWCVPSAGLSARTRDRIGARSRGNEAAAHQEAVRANRVLGQAVHMENLPHQRGHQPSYLTMLKPPDEETAIKKAIDQFEIGPALQNRLLAAPVIVDANQVGTARRGWARFHRPH